MISTKELPSPEDRYPVRRALLSVYDKAGLVDFARVLADQGVDLVSSGGTARTLREAGLPVSDVANITGFPEILDGRVKTLHPAIHGGLLARRTDPADLKQLEELEIPPFDLVVVNLYPFEEVVANTDVSEAEAIENIDIGGPAMVRAAAKNFFFTAVVTSPSDYAAVANEMTENEGTLGMASRRALALKAFERTAAYDQAIVAHWSTPSSPVETTLPDTFAVQLPRVATLRYGENPHQQAALYGDPLQHFTKLHGKDLSFNNLIDLSAALALIEEFRHEDPTCAILKHTNPCGVAVSNKLLEAYHQAFATDRQSPFGGVVVVNRPLDLETAKAINEIFTELIIAPAFEPGVLAFLQQKKNRRLIQNHDRKKAGPSLNVRSVIGGFLVQEQDPTIGGREESFQSYRVVTQRTPSEQEWQDLDFAWRVCKHVKSNAIVYAKNRATLGIGAGQMSRIDASEIAVAKGKKSGLDFKGAVVASDAFFPFADGLIEAVRSGARAAIQPGGSIRDDEVVAAADEHEVAMVFTGKRHFRH